LRPQIRTISVTFPRRDLNEFFEHEKFRGEDKVRVGRSWLKDELRLKSNDDLHKLWFVLLKERNMLLTMEQAYKDEYMPMPNPERQDKVAESMENLEEVVRERNRAYHKLEVGPDGEPQRRLRIDGLGRMVPYKPKQHAMPRHMNEEFRNKEKLLYHTNFGPTVVNFLAKMRERKFNLNKHEKWCEMRDAAKIIRRFPNVDMESLQERYPLVDPGKLRRWKQCRITEFSEID